VALTDSITDPIQVDPEQIFDDWVTYMQSVIPGWEPADGSLDVWMAEGFSQIAAQLGEIASDVTRDIFRWYGENITGLAPIAAVAATSTVTFTGTAGQTVPGGTNVAGTAPDGSLVGFITAADTTIGGGGTVAGVGIIATDPGSDGNDLTGGVQLVDSLAFVTAVSLDATTVGGSDEETTDDYLVRLVAEERLRTVSPILPRDFAQLAKRVLEVDRAAALDGYNPADGTSGDRQLRGEHR
jgi:hypothetical protein